MGANASGAHYALPIWSDFMRRAARTLPADSFIPPATLREQVLCSVTYQKATTQCPGYTEYFKEDDDVPSGTCRLHRGPSRVEQVRNAVKKWFDKIKGIFR